MIHGSAVALVRSDGAVLLQLRDDKPSINYPNVWALPGGHVEDGGESFKAAALRELLEETAYRAIDADLISEETYLNDKHIEVTRHVYLVKCDDRQELKCLEGQDLRFMLPEEFISLTMVPGHKEIAIKASKLVKP